MAQTWMTPADIYYQQQRDQQELDNLLLQLERQRYENAATDIYNQQNRMQFQNRIGSTAASNAIDRAYNQLRSVGMQGDITRQQQVNNRYDWGREEDIAGMQGREKNAIGERAKRLYGY